MSKWQVDHLLMGSAEKFRDEEKSAIRKHPVTDPVRITALGLQGDEQADSKHHGGPHMAVHLYPHDHHAFWSETIGEHPLLRDPGAFGSNLAVSGFTEQQVCIGDRFRLGEALLEVSQPRKPCWKIEHRFGRKGMVAAILKSGRCGWYFRVLEEGSVTVGDTLERVSVSDHGWSVARAFAALWGNPKSASTDDLRALAALSALTPGLQEKAAQGIP